MILRWLDRLDRWFIAQRHWQLGPPSPASDAVTLDYVKRQIWGSSGSETAKWLPLDDITKSFIDAHYEFLHPSTERFE